MGSFFAVQVYTGFEVEAKEMLKAMLKKRGIQSVKCIYAMEKADCIADELGERGYGDLTDGDISQYLHVKRLQAGLTNLRNACDRLKSFHDEDSLSLLESYRVSIRELTAELREARKNIKKVGSVLNGYILIELQDSNIHTFPADLMFVLKSVPKIIGLVNRNDIPFEEVELFFQQLDMTKEIEMEFDLLVDLTDIEEVEDTKQVLLTEANQVIGTPEEKELLQTLEDLDLSIENEIQVLASMNEVEVEAAPKRQLLGLLKWVRVNKSKKRERVTMPISLFRALYGDDNGPLLMINPMRERTLFVDRLKAFFLPSGERACLT